MIKNVIYSDTIDIYEQAILKTGELNYSKSLIKICQFYLDNHED